MLIQMHIALRERNAEAFGLQTFFDGFVQRKEYRLVIRHVHPRTNGEINTAVVHGGHPDKRRGIFQYALIFYNLIEQCRFGSINAVAIADAGGQIQPTGSSAE